MKDPLTDHSFRGGILSALLAAAGMILSVQGCLPPPGRVMGPPALVLPAPPFLYVIPGTYAYFAADVDIDIFFYQGYWYRPYGSRWYRAPEYNGPWTVIITNRVPPVLCNIPPAYRRASPPSGRLPYSDVRKNWRTWERDRHWDRHDERKRERYEEENRGQGRDNGMGRDRRQEPQQRRELPYQDRYENRDKDKERGRGTAPYEHQDIRRNSGPQYQPPVPPRQVRPQVPPQRDERPGQSRNQDLSGGNGRGRNLRPGQEGPSQPARRVTQPQVQQKQTSPKKQQDRKKVKGREEKDDQDSAPSQDGNEKGRAERGQGKGTGR